MDKNGRKSDPILMIEEIKPELDDVEDDDEIAPLVLQF
jgi:hypothetical protein